MIFRLLADVTIVVHVGFLAFVVAGGLLARRHRWLIAPHLIAAAWGTYVEAAPGIVCPLTPLENAFAEKAGMAGYEGSFMEHYLVPVLYPDGLTPAAQRALAGLVVLVNVAVYACPRGRATGAEASAPRRSGPPSPGAPPRTRSPGP
jgi:Protein of Unknown function (DUF2784)